MNDIEQIIDWCRWRYTSTDEILISVREGTENRKGNMLVLERFLVLVVDKEACCWRYEDVVPATDDHASDPVDVLMEVSFHEMLQKLGMRSRVLPRNRLTLRV